MKFKQLMYFQNVAAHGSITTAAARAHIAQSALSSQIAALEADLGVQLLIRHARGVTLTRPGEVLLDHAKQISLQLKEARRHVLEVAAIAGEVTIGIPVSMSAVLTGALLRALEEGLPGAQVHVYEGLTGDLRDWLRLGKIETGILYGNDQTDGLHVEPLADDELVLFGRSDSMATQGPSVPFGALAQFPLYTTDSEHPVRPMLNRLAKDHGIALQYGAQINSINQMKALAREGRGHTVLPRVALATEVLDDHIGVWLIDPAIKLRSYVASMNNPPSRILSVQRILRDVVRRLIQTGEWPGAVALEN